MGLCRWSQNVRQRRLVRECVLPMQRVPVLGFWLSCSWCLGEEGGTEGEEWGPICCRGARPAMRPPGVKCPILKASYGAPLPFPRECRPWVRGVHRDGMRENEVPDDAQVGLPSSAWTSRCLVLLVTLHVPSQPRVPDLGSPTLLRSCKTSSLCEALRGGRCLGGLSRAPHVCHVPPSN